MSTGNTETRILEMQLDNKDFEDGVRKTIKTLEDLEDKLNLKNAGDGFEKVSAAANSVQMSHLESGLDQVTNKFTLMGQIGLQALERISSKVVDMGERIVRAATIQPMIDGWGEFEMKTDSVQTILGGIRNQFDDQPTAIHAISEALDELNEYADKTIYNFAQMTENVGKFTNQGLDLQTSTNAIKGIANWAAAVGANPTQMSRAMYNISQSLGAGSMQNIDWRSIRFANMATPEVKKLFVEVAKRQGTVSEKGTVKLGKKVFDVLEQFDESLKQGWMTNDVIAEGLGIYAKAFSQEELIAKYGEELGKQFYEMGEYAEEAATKVRTFTQLIGVLKESLGSGWATSFDILFGGFEKQTEFLTAVKDRFEEIFNFQTEDRNTWLQNFSDIGGIQVLQDVFLKTIDILSDFYWVFNDVVALVLNPFGSSVFNMSDGIFGPRQEGYTEMKSTWESVKDIFDDISSTLDKFRTWLYTPNEKTGRSPIHNLASALSGVAGAAGIAWQVLTGFGKFIFRIFKRFEPLVSAVLDLLGQIGGAIYNVFFNLTGQQSVEKIFDRIESAVGPVIDVIVGLATAVVNLIHSFLGIDDAADDWTVLAERMEAFWDIFTYDQNLSFADNFSNSVKKALEAIFGKDTAASLIKAWDENIAPVLEQISNFFAQAFADLQKVLDGLTNAANADYSKAEGIKGKGKTFIKAFLEGYYGEDKEGAAEAFDNVLGIYQQIQEYYDTNVATHVESLTKIFTETLPELNGKIIDFIFGHEITGKRGNKWREGGLINQIKGYFEGDEWKQTWESIQKFVDDALEKIRGAWDKVVSFLFGYDEWVVTGPGTTSKFHRGGLFDQIKTFFTGEGWQETWASIQEGFGNATGWIEGAWNTFYDFLFGKEYDAGDGSMFRYGGLIEEIKSFFEGDTWAAIQESFNTLIAGIEEAWNKVENFLIGHEITGKQGNTWREGGIFSGIFNYFSSEGWSGVQESVNGALSWIEETWNKFGDAMIGHEMTDKYGHKWREGGILSGLINFFNSETWQEDWALIQESFTTVTTWIQEKGEAAWETILTFLFGPENEGQNEEQKRSGGAYDSALQFLTPVWDWIQSTGQKLYDYITTHNFQEMWEGLHNLLFGYDEWVITGPGTTGTFHRDGVLSPVIELLQPIADVFNKVKGWALEKASSIDWESIWTSIGRFFSGYDEVVKDKAGNETSVHHEGAFEKIANFFDRVIEYFNSPEFQEFWTNVKTFYHEHIEPVLNWLGGLGNLLFAALGGIFSGQGFSGFGSVGDYISTGFNTLMGKIFPDGFDLGSILSGDGLGGMIGSLLGYGGSEQQEAAKEAQKAAEEAQNGGGPFDWLINLFIGTANADEAAGEQIVAEGAAVVATLTQTEKSTEKTAGAVENKTNSIIDAVRPLLPYIGGGVAVGLVGKVSDMITGITGNRKPTILEQVSRLISSLGGAFQGIGIAIAAAGFAEWVSPGTLDKVFDRIDGVLDKIFGWMAGIAGGGTALSFFANWGLNGIASHFGFENPSALSDPASMLQGVGEAMSGVFEGIQGLFNLALEFAGADLFFGFDENGASNFDKKIDRVLVVVAKVLGILLGDSAAMEGLSILDSFATGKIFKNLFGSENGSKQKGNDIGKMLAGIGALATGVLDGTAALLSASILPSVMSIDIDKIGSLITTVCTALGAMAGLVEAGTIISAFSKVSSWKTLEGLAAAGGGIAIALGAIGSVALLLVNWFLGDIEERLKTMAPAMYSFISNVTGALQLIASVGDVELSAAEKILTEDLPRFLGEINSDEIGFDKAKMDERGTTIRDFGNRIYNGISRLSEAKAVFDKYNTGNNDFPIEFFREMTEALSYLQSDDVQALYDQVFGQGGMFYVGNTGKDEANIDGLNAFFSTLNGLGYAIVEYNEFDQLTGMSKSGRKVESTKEGLDAFQDAFSGIQNTFRLLINDISSGGFSVDKLNSLGDFLTKIAEAGDTFAKSFYYESTMIRMYDNTSPITQFAGWLQTMGTGIRQLNDSLKTNGVYDIDYAQIESALKALNPMAELEKTLYEYATQRGGDIKKGSTTRNWMYYTTAWLEDVSPKMQEMGTQLHAMAANIQPSDTAALDSASAVMNGLAALIGQDVYGEIGKMTVEQIGGYSSAFSGLRDSLLVTEAQKGSSIASLIQEVMNASGGKDVKLTITPVVDANGQLPEGMEMENTYSRMINLQMNMNDVMNVHVTDSQIEAIVSANNATERKIDSIAAAISQIQINVFSSGSGFGTTTRRVVENYPKIPEYQEPYEAP